MVRPNPDLHSLVYGTPWIDPRTLLAAVERELRAPAPDFRTRLLLRDSMSALARRWGEGEFETALSPDVRGAASRILAEDLGEAGFTSLDRRMADATTAETVLRFFRELGDHLRTPTRLDVGGSTALIAAGLLHRATDDIDAVDEVPPVIRTEYRLLEDLTNRYGLRLAHFQSHYLPQGWAQRLHSLGRFGRLDVYLVDPTDIAVGKLFSKRTKDRDDVRMLLTEIARPALEQRLKDAAQNLLADPKLRPDAEKNWYLLFGEPLPG